MTKKLEKNEALVLREHIIDMKDLKKGDMFHLNGMEIWIVNEDPKFDDKGNPTVHATPVVFVESKRLTTDFNDKNDKII